MAKLKGNFLVGLLAPLVLRVVNGKQIVSARPASGKIKQTKATKASDKVFGDGARLGKHVRKTLFELYPNLFQQSTSTALSGRLCKALNSSRNPGTGSYEFQESSFSNLRNFEFNHKSAVTKLMMIGPGMELKNNQLIVSLPDQSSFPKIKFPRNCTRCKISISRESLR